jgi:outer membrane protein OmpA-like peptidoglycan-associated protein
MEPITALILYFLAVFAIPEQGDLIVLVEDPDGGVGRIVVTSDGGSQTLDEANTAVAVDAPGATPSRPKALSDKDIQDAFGEVLRVSPAPPESFLLYFEAGTSNLTAESAARLDDVIAAFQARDLPRATIIGHTDTTGPADANFALALRRAEAIRARLADAGLPNDRTQARSHGERDLLVPTDDGTAEPRNRRVEITVW